MRCGSQPDVTQSNLSVHSEYINLQGNVNHQYENLDLKLVGIEGSSLVYKDCHEINVCFFNPPVALSASQQYPSSIKLYP